MVSPGTSPIPPVTTLPTSPPTWHSTTLSILLQRMAMTSYSVPSDDGSGGKVRPPSGPSRGPGLHPGHTPPPSPSPRPPPAPPPPPPRAKPLPPPPHPR